MILFEVNRLNFLKIFETHQFKGYLTLPDLMNITASLKLYPDHISSLEIQTIFQEISGLSHSKVTLVEFEDFLKKLAQKLSMAAKSGQDPSKSFINLIKTPAFNSYGIQLKTTIMKPHKSSGKAFIIKKHTSTKSFNNRPSVRKSDVLIKTRSTKDIFDSAVVEYTEVSNSIRRPSIARSNSLSTSLSYHVEKFSSFISRQDVNKTLRARRLKPCLQIHNLNSALSTSIRLFFLLWKLSI